MVKKELARKGLMLVLLLTVSPVRAVINPGDLVVVPNWWEQVDTIVSALDGVSNAFSASSALYAQWYGDLSPLSGELASRNQERIALYKCIRDNFTTKLSEINALNLTIDQKTAVILSLEDHVAFLELEINRLNQDIAAKNQEITDATIAYDLVLGANAEQADRLLNVVNELNAEYDLLVKDRNKFRTVLEDSYNKLQTYTAEVRIDALDIANEICGPEFTFSS